MPVKLVPLHPDDRKSVQSLAMGIYFDGERYAFAIAMHHSLRWPIVGLMNGEVIRHACVRRPHTGDYDYLDVRGIMFTLEQVTEPFGLSPPYTVKEVTEEELRRAKPINDVAISGAVWMAQALWPDLPWVEGPLVKHRTFLLALEELCRVHGVYIRAPFATALPILCDREGDEQGFTLAPSTTGSAYFFDRQL